MNTIPKGKEKRKELDTMVKQVVFRDKFENTIHTGIKLDDGNIICGCCGGIIEPEDYSILHTYEDWMNLEEGIIGDDYAYLGKEKK